jgi:hypothetical protein
MQAGRQFDGQALMGNTSEFLRHDSESIIDPRTMHEIHLPAFEACVELTSEAANSTF